MLKAALICAAFVLVGAGAAPASADCYRCCNGTGLTAAGHCQSTCAGECPILKMSLMRQPSKCAAPDQLLVCNGPHCKWMCTSGAAR